MTSKLEKEFFDTFGIEQKELEYPDNFIYYPEITNKILLKLICYLSRYDLDLIPECVCFKTIDQLKEHVLKCALKFKIANTIPMLYSQDLQKIFREA